MHPTTAKNLIISLYQAADRTTPISKQIALNFTPSLLGGITSKKSLMGRISRFFLNRDTEAEREAKVRNVFARAIQSLAKKPEALKGIGDHHWQRQLYQELQSDKAIQDKLPPTGLDGPKELDILIEVCEKVAVEEAKQKRMEMLQNSLLRNYDIKNDSPITLEQLKEIFYDGADFNPTLLKHYLDHLKANNKPLVDGAEDKVTVLKAANELRRHVKESFFPKGKPISEDERYEKRRQIAQSLAAKITDLKPNQSLMFLGGFGKKQVDLDHILSLANLLPDSTLDKLPFNFKALVRTGQLADPLNLAENFFESKLAYAKNKASGALEHPLVEWLFANPKRKLPDSLEAILPTLLASPLQKCVKEGALETLRPLLGALIRDDERHLPQIVKNILPSILSSKIDNALKAGFLENLLNVAQYSLPVELYEPIWIITQNQDLLNPLGNDSNLQFLGTLIGIATFLPTEEAVQSLKQLVENSHTLSSPEGRKAMTEKLEQQLRNYSTGPLNAAKSSVNHYLQRIFSEAQGMLPPDLFEFFDMDQYFSNGNLWVELVKQPNDQFSVLIYTSGILLNNHPNDNGKIQWPLKIQNVDADKIDKDLFDFLLKLDTEPDSNKETVIKLEEIWKSLTDYLNGEITLENNNWRVVPTTTNSEMELLNLAVTDPSVSPSEAFFEMRLNALIRFTRPYLKGENKHLEIDDDTVCELLEKTSKTLLAEARVQKGSFSKNLYARIKATFDEINEAITDYRICDVLAAEQKKEKNPVKDNPLHISPEIMERFKAPFHQLGIDADQIKGFKPFLVHAFPEIEEFVDALASSLGTKPETTSKPLPKKAATSDKPEAPKPLPGKQGWLRDCLRSYYFSMAVSALKLGVGAVRIYQGQFPAYLLYMAITTGTRFVLPANVYDWISHAFNMIMIKCIEMTFRLVLWLILKPDQLEEFYSNFENVRSTIRDYAKIALGKNEVSFDLKEPVKPLPSQLPPALEVTLSLPFTVASQEVSIDNSDDRVRLDNTLYLKSASTPLDPKDLLDSIWAAIRFVGGNPQGTPEQHYVYLTNLFKRIPVPQKSNDPFWDKVPNTDEVFQYLTYATICLDNVRIKIQELTEEDFGDVVVLNYGIVAGLDYLAKRHPEMKKYNYSDYTINYFDLITWMIGDGAMLSDPVCQIKLNQILDYFGVSLDSLPKNDQEVIERGKDSLFYYYDQSWNVANFIWHVPNAYNTAEERWLIEFDKSNPQVMDKILDVSFTKENFKKFVADPTTPNSFFEMLFDEVIRKQISFFLNTKNNLYPESLYPTLSASEKQLMDQVTKDFPPQGSKNYNALRDLVVMRLKDPHLKHRYPDLYNIIEDYFITKDIYRWERIKILFIESNIHSRPPEQQILPQAYMFLRHQTLFSSLVARGGVNRKSPFKFGSTFGSNHIHIRKERNDDALSSAIHTVQPVWNAPYLVEYTTLYLQHLSSEDRSFRIGAHLINFVPKLKTRTQSDIMGEIANPDSDSLISNLLENYFEKPLPANGISQKLFQSALIERPDAIIRVLGYLRRDKAKLAFSICREFLNHIFFNVGNLQKQLLEYPKSQKVIGDFFKEQFDYYYEKKEYSLCVWLLYFGFRTKIFCDTCSPTKMDVFPDFMNQLERLNDNLGQSNSYWWFYYHHIKVLILTSQKNLTEEQEQEVAASMFYTNTISSGRALFIFKQALFQEQDTTFLNQINQQVERLKWEWHSKLNHMLLFETPRNNIFNKLLAHIGIKDEESAQFLEKNTYKKGSVLIKPFEGIIKTDYPLFTLAQRIRFIAADCGVPAGAEMIVSGGKCIFPKENVIFEPRRVEVDNDAIVTKSGEKPIADRPRYKIKPKKIVDGKTYQYTFSSGLIDLIKLSKNHIFRDYPASPPDYFTTWVEETESDTKSVYLTPSGVSFKITKLPNNEKYYVVGGEPKEEEVLVFEDELKREALEPLTRFSPSQFISCYARAGQQVLSRITFNRYGFSFEINKEGKAINDELAPGYHIAPRQFNPQLNAFGSYLLLENNEGQRKVILPQEQIVKTFGTSYLSMFGPLARKLMSYLTYELPLGDKCFVYQMTADGYLTSDNPDAIVNLIMLYLVQGNERFADRACAVLEDMSKKDPLPESTFKQLSHFLLCPIDMHGSRLIRLRLIAALEENRGKHNLTDAGEPLIESLIAIVTMLDLTKVLALPKNQRNLNEYQQWIIYQSFFRRSYEIFKKIAPQERFNTVAKMAEKMGWESIIESIGFNKALYDRYQKLKSKFEKNDSLVVRGLRLVAQVARTPSRVPDFNLSFNPTSLVSTVPSHAPVKDSTFIQLATLSKKIFWHKLFTLSTLNLEDLVQNTKQIIYPIQVDISGMTAKKFKENFLAYCLVAKADRESPAFRALKTGLPLLNSGWDRQTQLLIKYLEAIINHPYLFWAPYEFIKAFQKNPTLAGEKDFNKLPLEQRYPALIPFFEHLNVRSLSLQGVSVGSKVGLSKAFNFYVDQVMKMNANSGVVNMHAPLIANSIVQWGASFAQVMASELFKKGEVEEVSKTYNTPRKLFQPLDLDDQFIDDKLKAIYSITFETLGPRKEGAHIEPIEILDEHKQYAAGFKRVNQSLIDYYNRPERIQYQIKVKSKESLFDSYVELVNFRDAFKAQLSAEGMKLMNLFDEKTTLQDIARAFLYGKYQTLRTKKGIPANELQRLELSIARHFVRSTRLQQIERAVRYYEELARINPQTDRTKFESKMEQIADELCAKRVYKFNDCNVRLARRLMMFELVTDKMVWQKQYDRVKDVLLGGEENLVVELLMSLGKTYFAVPVFDSFAANGTQIVVNIFPSQTFETVIRQSSTQSKEIFFQDTNVFHFNRSQKLTPKNWDYHLLILKRALEYGETINMIREDAQAIDLIFKDQMDRFKKGGRAGQEALILPKIQEFLRVLRTKGKVIGDEAHELFNRKQELSYPIGSPVNVDAKYYAVMEACMRHMTSLPDVMKAVQANETQKLKEGYETEIMLPIARKMADYALFEIQDPSQREEFVRYVCGKTKTIPTWIRKHEHYSCIALVKGVLTKLLTLTLGREVNVEYGVSKENKGENARPYEGNTSPLEQASIRNPYESFIKTFIQFLHEGLNGTQIEKLKNLMLKRALADSKKRQIPVSETAAYKTYQSWLPKGSTNRLNDQKTHSDLAHSSEAILHYIRYFVQKQIKYWKKNSQSGPQDFANMFASGYYDTGTPSNFGTYPAYLKMLFDPGTIGEALHIISEKCPKNGIHELESQSPSKILDEVLDRFFKKGSEFTALIDGSALLKGITNDQVATRMMEFIIKERPDIQGIVYFTKGKDKKEQAMCIEKGAKEPVPLDRCSIPPEKRLSYYDQRHGFAADIPQKANGIGLDLVGEKATLQRIMQEVFRMRGIKKWKKLMGLDGDDGSLSTNETTQTVHFAYKKDIKQIISGNKDKTELVDIIKFVIINEQKVVLEDNPESYPDKVIGIIKRAVMDKCLFAKNLDTMMDIFDEFYDILIHKMEDDPGLLFGPIEINCETAEFLKRIRDHGYNLIKDSSRFSQAELAIIKDKLESLPTDEMPAKRTIYVDGGDVKTDVLKDLNKELYVEVEDENEAEDETENNRENELQNQNQNQFSIPSFEENPWEGKFNPHSTDWIKLTSPNRISVSRAMTLFNYVVQGAESETPPLFSLKDLVAGSCSPHVAAAKDAFDERIWISNNFVPTFVGLNEEVVDVGSRLERELYELLIHFREPKPGVYEIVSVGCLSQKDGTEFRKRFFVNPPQGETKALLYCTQNKSPVAGADVDLDKFINQEALVLLEGQLKLLNGDVYFPERQRDLLVQWAKKQNGKKLAGALLSFHGARGLVEDLHGTDLEIILRACGRLSDAEDVDLSGADERKRYLERQPIAPLPPPLCVR